MISSKYKFFTLISCLFSSALFCSSCAPLNDFDGYYHTPIVVPSDTDSAIIEHIRQKILPAPGDPIDKGQLPDTPSTDIVTPFDNRTTRDSIDLKTVVGVWRADIDGRRCQLATPLTKFGKGYRAGPIHCPSSFSQVRSWAVDGNHLLFFDASGLTEATLYASGLQNFVGQTKTGHTIILSR